MAFVSPKKMAGEEGRGRRPKIYRQRRNPLIYFDDVDFLGRYRLPKPTVIHLAERFSQSEFISTQEDPRGMAITPEERVRKIKHCFIVIKLVFPL